MKLIVETGSESHSTSSASLQVRYHGGPDDGKYLYQIAGREVAHRWLESDKHSHWVQTEYDLPDGTELEVIGRGQTGMRGANKHAFHRVYRLDSQAEILEEHIAVGLRTCLLKGRLTLLYDLQADKERPLDTEKGF